MVCGELTWLFIIILNQELVMNRFERIVMGVVVVAAVLMLRELVISSAAVGLGIEQALEGNMIDLRLR